MERARSFASAKHWAEAEACLDQFDSQAPRNRDSVFFRAPIKAFQGQHDEALALVEEWPDADRESREIRGDLAWYAGDVNASEKWYRAAADEEAPVETWKLWIRSLKAQRSPAYSKAIDKALIKFPDDSELIGMKRQLTGETKGLSATASAIPKRNKTARKPATDAAAYRSALGATYIRETQNQSVKAFDADTAVIYHRKSFSLGASSISRDYGPATFTDTILRGAMGMGFAVDPNSWLQSHEANLTLGGAPDASFSPRRYFIYRHELFFSDVFSVYAEIGARWYPDAYARISNIGLSYVRSQVRYQARIYNTHVKSNNVAAYFGAEYQDWPLSPGIFVFGGRDAASRPYLFDSENAAFFAVGGDLTYKLSNRWAARGVYEERFESGFRQKSLSAVILWFDR